MAGVGTAVLVGLCVAMTWPGAAMAQDRAVTVPPGAATPAAGTGPASASAHLADSVSPFGAVAASDEARAAVTRPNIVFTPTGAEAKDFDKYYVFHRPGTDFATAYADISECDGYARGLSSGIGYQQTPYPYAGTMAGAVGGAIGNAMAAAIFGSAEKRRLRRVNMRTCMNFKGYERHGLPKALWEAFNFEEGLDGVSEKDRRRYLMQQSLVASALEKPQGEGLGL